jgi:hypothetical protein
MDMVREKTSPFPGKQFKLSACCLTFAALFIFLAMSGGFAGAHAAEKASFSWLANPPEDNVIGYRLYYASESRFASDQTLKPDFSYDYYIDFGESKRCVHDGTDTNCQDLSGNDFQCENLYGDAPLCTVKNLRGIQFFAMTAYNAQTESDWTRELSVRFDEAVSREVAALSVVTNMLLLKNKR